MSNKKISPAEIKILGEGEEVVNLWPTESGYGIVIKNQKGEVYLVSVNLDENKIPRIEINPDLIITHKGKDEIIEFTSNIETPEGKIKVTTF